MKNLPPQRSKTTKRVINAYPAAIPQAKQLIEDTFLLYMGVLEMNLDNGTITQKKYSAWKMKYSTIKNIQLKKLGNIVSVKPLYKMLLKCRSDLKRAMEYAAMEAEKDTLLYESGLQANAN